MTYTAWARHDRISDTTATVVGKIWEPVYEAGTPEECWAFLRAYKGGDQTNMVLPRRVTPEQILGERPVEYPPASPCKGGTVLHHWVVFSTALEERALLCRCQACGAYGAVEDPSAEEWDRAFYAPSSPYAWDDPSRVRFIAPSEKKA